MDTKKQLGKAAIIFLFLIIAVYYLPAWKHRAEKSEESSIKVSSARTGFRFEYDEFCDTRFNSGGWVGIPNVSCDSTTRSVATCGQSHTDNWQWSSEALRCGAERQGPTEFQRALANRWIVVAGDSIARFFFASLLRLASHDSSQQIVYGHQDFEYTLPNNIRATFKWAPYITNLTVLLSNWTREGVSPDAVVMSAGLWHMLHIDDPADYAKQLQLLGHAIKDFVGGLKVAAAPPMSFFSISEVFPPKLKTEEKRKHLTYQNVDFYNEAIQESGLLVPDGALYLVDLHHLTQGCGPTCSHDGLHYSNATYDAALQIWAVNTLSVINS
ncbi:g9723 [Coccomyxa elongata]